MPETIVRTANVIGAELLEKETEARTILAKYKDATTGGDLPMSADDEARATLLTDECEVLATELRSANKTGSLANKLDASLAETRSQGGRILTPFNGSNGPADMSVQTRFKKPNRVHKVGNLRNFPNTPEGEASAYAFAQTIIFGTGAGRISDDLMSDSTRYIKDNGIEVRALSENSNISGGFLVPPEFSDIIIDLREKFGVFKPNARLFPMSSDQIMMPRRKSGLTAYFSNENAAITDSIMNWTQVQLNAKKLTTLVYYPSELGADAMINIGDYLAGEIAYAFANKEDLCGFLGDGTSTYGGIVGVKNALVNLGGTPPQIFVSTATSWAAITLADIMSVIAQLTEYADNNDAKIFCTRQFYYQVLKRIALQAGGNTAEDILRGVMVPMFAGIPVVFTQVLPTGYAGGGQYAMYYGNLPMAAAFGERNDLALASTNVGGNTFVNDQIAIRGIERFDINVHDVGTATAAGPMCALKLS